MAPPRKTIAQYEAEAKFINGCLVHPNGGPVLSRKVYRLRHSKKPIKYGKSGPIPQYKSGNQNGLCVCHTCDNPLCILDKHHFLGTRKDNVLDSVKKKRHSCFRKGGTRFSGPHTEDSRIKIGKGSKRVWASMSKKQRKVRTGKILLTMTVEQRSARARKIWESRRAKNS